MERYMRILNFDSKCIYVMSFQILKFQLNDVKFLNYRPSQLAACAIIISLNISRKEYEIEKDFGIFSKS